MSIPGYGTFMLPLLKLVGGGDRRVRDAIGELADQFRLTDEERKQLLPSGRIRLFNNRVHWAATYLVHAGLLERPQRGVLAITDRGRAVLSEGLGEIDKNYLMRFPEFRVFVGRQDEEEPEEQVEPPGSSLSDCWSYIASPVGRCVVASLKNPLRTSWAQKNRLPD